MAGLKWYCGVIRYIVSGHHRVHTDEKPVIVCTTSERRAHHLLKKFDPGLSLYYVQGWFSRVKFPPIPVEDKEQKEAVWMALVSSSSNYKELWPTNEFSK